MEDGSDDFLPKEKEEMEQKEEMEEEAFFGGDMHRQILEIFVALEILDVSLKPHEKKENSLC